MFRGSIFGEIEGVSPSRLPLVVMSHHSAYSVGVSSTGSVFIRNCVKICQVVQQSSWKNRTELSATKTADYVEGSVGPRTGFEVLEER